MNAIIRSAFKSELESGKRSYLKENYQQAFLFFERSHILGQRDILCHVTSHFWMLKIGIKTRNPKEIFGQLIRIPLGFFGSLIGVVPHGNSGGSNVRALKSMQIPEDLKKILDSGK